MYTIWQSRPKASGTIRHVVSHSATLILSTMAPSALLYSSATHVHEVSSTPKGPALVIGSLSTAQDGKYQSVLESLDHREVERQLIDRLLDGGVCHCFVQMCCQVLKAKTSSHLLALRQVSQCACRPFAQRLHCTLPEALGTSIHAVASHHTPRLTSHDRLLARLAFRGHTCWFYHNFKSR